MKSEKQTQIDYLNETVLATLKPSPIHGIGVFAIQDIKAGESFVRNTSTFFDIRAKELDELGLNPEIKKIILQRHQELGLFQSPNCDQNLQAYMNHSPNPNSTGTHAIRDIKTGEEITENYTQFGYLNEELQKCV